MTRRQAQVIGDAIPEGQTPERFALAQIASIAAWPVIAKTGVIAAATGFEDYLDYDLSRYANGKTAIAGRFFDTSDGSGTGLSIQDIQTGIVVPGFDTSGDFTVGARFYPGSLTVSGGTWGGLALGSYSSANNAWRLENDTSGRFRMGAPGGLQSAYTDYTGPVIVQSTMMYVVLRFFRATGTLNLRVNGVYEQNFQNSSLIAAAFANELALGLFWDFSVTATKYRSTQLVKAVAAAAALTDAELALLEAYLASTTIDQ